VLSSMPLYELTPGLRATLAEGQGSFTHPRDVMRFTGARKLRGGDPKLG